MISSNNALVLLAATLFTSSAVAQTTVTVSTTSSSSSASSSVTSTPTTTTGTTSNPVVSLFVPAVDYSTSLSASVIGANSLLTTYAVLISGTTSTLTEGDSTFIFTSSADATGGGSATVTCSLDGATSTAGVPATSAVCVGASIPTAGRTPTPQTSTLTGAAVPYITVTITANAAALASGATAPPATAVTTGATTTTAPSVGGAAAAAHTGLPAKIGAVAAVGVLGWGLL